MDLTIKRSTKQNINNLVNDLRDRIHNGELAAGMALPTAEELARDSGASAITVNRIMAKLAAEGLVNRVKGKGTFVSVPGKSSRKYTIGISFLAQNGNFQEVATAFSVFERCASQLVSAQGHEVCYISLPELHSPERGRKLLEQTDALIISASCIDPQGIKLLLEYQRPCVVIQQSHPLSLPFHQVIPELSCGFIAAIKRFRQMTAEKITVVSKCDGTHMERANSFIHCARTMGFAEDELEIVQGEHVMADFGRIYGYQIGKRILSANLSRTIFSGSDFFSFGIIDAFKEAGLTPCQDYRLISFDDLEGDGLLPFGDPFMTTVTFPKQEIVSTAVNLALRQIEHPDPCFSTVRVPTTLIIRKTC